MSDDAVAALQRWQDSGAHWVVFFRLHGVITVGLYRCDGGEEVDRYKGTRIAEGQQR